MLIISVFLQHEMILFCSFLLTIDKIVEFPYFKFIVRKIPRVAICVNEAVQLCSLL